MSLSSVHASVVLLTYNQEDFVGDALRSLLDQDYQDLQIVVSDDNSADSTWRVVNSIVEAYVGSKRIILNRNSTNLGLVGNYEAAFALTTGDVVFSSAGDDLSTPDRCSECIKLWLANDRRPDLIGTDAYDMDLSGNVLGIKCMDELHELTLSAWAVKRPYQFGASHMLTRRLLALNPMRPQLSAEDQCFIFRALLMGGAMRLNAPKVYHRRSGMSGRIFEKTFNDKISNLKRSAKRGLDELNQMQQDADILGQGQIFRSVTQAQVDLYMYMLAQLESKKLTESFRMLCNMRTIKFAKRIRFFMYANLSLVFRGVYFLKALKNG